MNNLQIYIVSVFCMTEIIVIVAIETIGYYSLDNSFHILKKYLIID